jgi:hypothetical protein
MIYEADEGKINGQDSELADGIDVLVRLHGSLDAPSASR